MTDADVIVVGAGLAGLVATAELADAGRRGDPARPGARGVVRRPGVLVASAACSSSTAPSSGACASATRASSPGRTGSAPPASTAPRTSGRAAGRRPTSTSPRARSAAWLHAQGVRLLPNVGWAERGGYGAIGHGNSVPRFHVTWGTGPGVLEPFVRRVRAAARPRAGASCASATASTRSPSSGGAVDRRQRRACSSPSAGQARASELARARRASSRSGARRSSSPRAASARNHELVRAQLARSASATPPKHMISGVPDHVDGRMIADRPGRGRRTSSTPTACGTTSRASATGTRSGADHGIRILPGPSSLWLDATRQAPAGAALPRLRHARHARAHHDAPATTTRGSC